MARVKVKGAVLAQELAGMVERCDFTMQTSVGGDDGLLRPDLLVRLAGGRHLITLAI